MSRFVPLRLLVFSFCLVVLIAGRPSGLAAQEKAPKVPAETQLVTGAIASPEMLPRLLAMKAELLEKNIAALEPQLTGSGEDLARSEKTLQGLRLAVASLKATLALGTRPGPRVEELLGT